MSGETYLFVGGIFGVLIGLATFLGAYIYCISTYGFLFGFGLGWIPSGILAFIIGHVVRFIWPLLVAFVIWITWMVFAK